MLLTQVLQLAQHSKLVTMLALYAAQFAAHQTHWHHADLS